MLKSLILFTILFSVQAFGQTFKLTDSQRVNFEVCQVNHNLILDKFIDQMNSQGTRMIKGISIEKKIQTPEFKLKLYKSVLKDVVLKRIIYSEIKKQLNSQK